ncbi:MAG: hypothetical protein AAB250_13650, partial [Bdellovibrionota bacterium]
EEAPEAYEVKKHVSAFREKLRARYRYLEGSREVWEVRALNHSTGTPGRFGYKEALLNDPDMKNQHTDSNSVGMIEITKTDEPQVRDLRDWNAEEKGRPARFLKDVAKGEIHYYFSKKHETTSRAKIGENPPILSVIRALTKAYQFGLKFPSSDLKKMKEIIDAFDPSKAESRSLQKLEQAGKKLIQHAVDIETAVVQLDQLGLRTKLARVSSTADGESLAVWISKEPLRTRPLGQAGPDGKLGKTAKELGIEIVAHETKSFVAYESITRATTGVPNVLISRKNATGETALHGDGFYKQIGRKGARGTNLTIRFEVDPTAREGSDFILAGNFVIVRNKTAIRVIAESLDFSLEGYLRFLLGSTIDATDKALIEKLNRRMERYKAEMTPEKMTELKTLVIDAAKNLKDGRSTAIFSEWFKITGSHDQMDLLLALAESWEGTRYLLHDGFADSDWLEKSWAKPEYRPLRTKLLETTKTTLRQGTEVFQYPDVFDSISEGRSILSSMTMWNTNDLWRMMEWPAFENNRYEVVWKQVDSIPGLLSRNDHKAA